jgi:CRISPR type III-associated protein (TIGR04423 family)
MTKIDIDKIDYSLKFDGYYWYSNKKKPEIILRTFISKEIFTSLPFIIEGNLFCSENELSINIKHIDGEYQVYQVILKDLPIDQISEQDYITHDLDQIGKMTLLQHWEETLPDPLLAGMTTLIPTWQAFKGFTK